MNSQDVCCWITSPTNCGSLLVSTGSVKTLHLFEARYLALLEEVLSSPKSNKLFGHVVVEQPGDPVGSKASAFPGAYVGENFVFLMGTLVRVSGFSRGS